MSFTFSIRKGYEILLEVTANEDILSKETILAHFIERCFERIFYIIKNGEIKQENEVILKEESEEEETE